MQFGPTLDPTHLTICPSTDVSDDEDFKAEQDIKQETKPEFQNDATEFDIERNDAEKAELHEVDEEGVGEEGRGIVCVKGFTADTQHQNSRGEVT